MARRVVNVDNGGSLSDRFANIESKRQTSRPVQVQTRQPAQGGVAKYQRPPVVRGGNGSSRVSAVQSGRGGRANGRGQGGRRDSAGRGNAALSARGARGGGRGRGGRGGRGKRGDKKPSKESLDRELDAYMLKDEKIGQDLLDKELEEYMSSRGAATDDGAANTEAEANQPEGQ